MSDLMLQPKAPICISTGTPNIKMHKRKMTKRHGAGVVNRGCITNRVNAKNNHKRNGGNWYEIENTTRFK